MKRTKFNPVPGNIYNNNGGGVYECIDVCSKPYSAVMLNVKSGWQCECFGIRIYEDSTIDWNYSLHGFFIRILLENG